MKAVLLAAGVGKRLGVDHPKALLEFDGQTLLARHLENLRRAGAEIRVVTGYAGERMRPHLVGTEVLHNKAFERGSVLSLRVGLEGLDDDVLIMDADVLYAASILDDVIGLPRGFAIDTDSTASGEEMMIGVRDGQVRAIRRRLAGEYDLTGEGVGFFKLDRALLPALRRAIEATDPDTDYECALDLVVAEHGADYVLVEGRPWTEIDMTEDLIKAETSVLPRL